MGVPIHVFGPETHMTSIVSMALGKKEIPQSPKQMHTTANFLLPTGGVSNYTYTDKLSLIVFVLFIISLSN